MRKILIIILFVSSAKMALAQKNFEGQINYKMFGFDDSKKDSTYGQPYRIFFGKNAIKIERLSKDGSLWQDQLIFLDSLKEITIDHRKKTWWQSWKASGPSNFSIATAWGMNKAQILNTQQKIAGYKAYIVRLSNSKDHKYGYIDLYAVKNILYHLPPQISKYLFMEGFLFYDDHIMLQIRFIQDGAPHSQIIRIATNVEAQSIKPSEFEIPKDYTETIQKTRQL